MEIKNIIICGLGALGLTYADKLKDCSNLKILANIDRINKYKNNPPKFNSNIMNLEYILSELNSGRPIVIPVKSSNLTTLSYNPFTKQLTVLFSRGTIYKYDNVDIDIVVKLLMSESLGKFFNQNIVNKYNFTRLHKDGSINYRG